MLEDFLSQLGLPNLHPLVVHYPIALGLLALSMDVVAFLLAKRRWIAKMAATLWVVAALTGYAAQRTGEDAAGSVVVSDTRVEEAIARHEQWAERTVWAVGAVALLRVIAGFMAARRPERFRPAMLPLLLLELGAAVCLFETAEHGGRLVYVHGVGVAAVDARPAQPEAEADRGVTSRPELARATPPSSPAPQWTPGTLPAYMLAAGGQDETRLVSGDPGSVVAGDGSWKIELPPGAVPLRLEGTRELADVAVDAVLELAGFAGSVALVHHAAAGSEDALVYDGSSLKLERRRAGQPPEVLATTPFKAAAERHSFRIVATGLSQTGEVDGQKLVEASAVQLPPGRIALEVAGTGAVTLHGWRAEESPAASTAIELPPAPSPTLTP